MSAADLIVQVDGGHLKDKSPEARSFEAMASVVGSISGIDNVCWS
jgi:hypothetical protein